jgi:metal-dependent amidase/aminoacylase/carboxypeptidase family protein
MDEIIEEEISMINKVTELLEEIKAELVQLSSYIWNNPELGSNEHKACAAHVELLRKHGFEVEVGFFGIETSFKAVYRSGKPGF